MSEANDRTINYKKEYHLVRTKKINFRRKPAIAVFFQNMTEYVNQLRLESQILEEKNRNETQESYTSTMSHEFRTPLSTSLIFLEGILNSTKDPELIRVIALIMM